MPEGQDIRTKIIAGIHAKGREQMVGEIEGLLRSHYRDLRLVVPGLLPVEGTDPAQLNAQIKAFSTEVMEKGTIHGVGLDTIKLTSDLTFEGTVFAKGQSFKNVLDSVSGRYTRSGGIFDRIGNAIANGATGPGPDGKPVNSSPGIWDFIVGFFQAIFNPDPRHKHLKFFDRVKATIADRVMARTMPGVQANLRQLVATDPEARDAIAKMGRGDVNRGVQVILSGLQTAAYAEAGIAVAEAAKPEDVAATVPMQTLESHRETITSGVRDAFGPKIAAALGLKSDGTALSDAEISAATRTNLNLLTLATGGKINNTNRSQLFNLTIDVATKAASDGITDQTTILTLIKTRIQGDFKLTEQQAQMIVDQAASVEPSREWTSDTLTAELKPKALSAIERMGTGPNTEVLKMIDQEALATLLARTTAGIALDTADPAYKMAADRLQQKFKTEIEKNLPADITTLLKSGTDIPPQLHTLLNSPEGRSKISALIAISYVQPGSEAAKNAGVELQNMISNIAYTEIGNKLEETLMPRDSQKWEKEAKPMAALILRRTGLRIEQFVERAKKPITDAMLEVKTNAEFNNPGTDPNRRFIIAQAALEKALEGTIRDDELRRAMAERLVLEGQEFLTGKKEFWNPQDHQGAQLAMAKSIMRPIIDFQLKDAIPMGGFLDVFALDRPYDQKMAALTDNITDELCHCALEDRYKTLNYKNNPEKLYTEVRDRIGNKLKGLYLFQGRSDEADAIAESVANNAMKEVFGRDDWNKYTEAHTEHQRAFAAFLFKLKIEDSDWASFRWNAGDRVNISQHIANRVATTEGFATLPRARQEELLRDGFPTGDRGPRETLIRKLLDQLKPSSEVPSEIRMPKDHPDLIFPSPAPGTVTLRFEEHGGGTFHPGSIPGGAGGPRAV